MHQPFNSSADPDRTINASRLLPICSSGLINSTNPFSQGA